MHEHHNLGSPASEWLHRKRVPPKRSPQTKFQRTTLNHGGSYGENSKRDGMDGAPT